jgi:hypothetical protein
MSIDMNQKNPHCFSGDFNYALNLLKQSANQGTIISSIDSVKQPSHNRRMI